MISKNKKFVFIHIPKTGGSSIEKCLKKYSTDKITGNENNVQVICNKTNNNYKHATLQQHKNIYGDIISDYFKFTVIRNPWDRLISLWHWGGNGNFNKKKFINKIKTRSKEQGAWAPMVNYICKDNKILVDKIVRFENLDKEFHQTMNKMDIKITLPHINKTKHRNYTSYYDDELKTIIEQYYKKDIELFNYKFD